MKNIRDYINIVESELVSERYSLDNSYLLKYFKNENIDPHAAWWGICQWIEKNLDMDRFDAIGANDLSDQEIDEVWSKLAPDEQEEAYESAIETLRMENPVEVPTKHHMDLQSKALLKPNTWLVHFSDSAKEIGRAGFEIGAPHIDRLGLTKFDFNQNVPGYNFAFKANDRHLNSKKNKYGSDFVMFQSSGVDTYHYGDEENQIVFWGQDVDHRDIIVAKKEYDSYVIRSTKTNEKVVERDNPSEIVEWVLRNFAQYRKHITRR